MKSRVLVLDDGVYLQIAEIHAFIARRNPERADSFTGEIYDFLEDAAAKGVPGSDMGHIRPHLRGVFHDKYVGLFYLTAEEFRVVYVTQGSRKLPKLRIPGAPEDVEAGA